LTLKPEHLKQPLRWLAATARHSTEIGGIVRLQLCEQLEKVAL
jgi:hypothetical protein